PYQETRYRTVRPRRSWGKTALTIAGGSATGAGIGGIVNGKRGALIGAAIGGGAASLYESAKRREPTPLISARAAEFSPRRHRSRRKGRRRDLRSRRGCACSTPSAGAARRRCARR